MCSSCKKSGQWDMLQSFLTTNKGTKKWKLMQMTFPELESLNEGLRNVINTTSQLKSFLSSEQKDILKKFQLPVSTF